MTRRLIVAGIVLVAMLATGVGGFIFARWSTIPPQVQGSLVSGIFTMVAAMGGALVVFWQLRRQAVNTIKANRKNENMKLKKEVYQEIIAVCDKEMMAEAAIIGLLRKYFNEASVGAVMASQGLKPTIPTSRHKRLVKLVHKHSLAVAEVVGLTEKWEIIDPRVFIFRPALHVRRKELLLAQVAYNSLAVVAMPMDLTDGPFWLPPNQQKLADLQARTNAVIEALITVGMCVGDYRTEMQNALLGRLFRPKKASIRKPEDPNHRAIKLAHYDELLEYFEQHEHWGKAQDEATWRVRSALSTHSQVK